MCKIAKWYNNYQSPCVLMIDDLSDAYIEVYKENYKNDWGYLCNQEGSSFDFLQKKLLNFFPKVKITFFVPYLKHAVINKNSNYAFKKFELGEREEYTYFLKFLTNKGHEIAHHGSDHGIYINENNTSTVNNWIHEWELFKNVDDGVKTVKEGVVKFRDLCKIDVVGGKYCGYKSIENSKDIIDQSEFLYWCENVNYLINNYNENIFGENEIISFPTNLSGNLFVKYSYLTGNKIKDKIKKVLKYIEPIVNIYNYRQIRKLYLDQNIISIQEHNSPSTSSGTVQSANVISDIKSLNKIFSFLDSLSIYYATCQDISKYIYAREKSLISSEDNKIAILFENTKNIQNVKISIINDSFFKLRKDDEVFISEFSNMKYVVNLTIKNGENIFNIEA